MQQLKEPTRRIGRAINRLGDRYGRLIVIARADLPGPSARWHCLCDCGNETTVEGNELQRGGVASCGCLRRECLSGFRHGHGAKGKRSPEYQSWMAAKARTTNPNGPKWALYGGRGIRMCAQWLHDFPAFLAALGPRPPGHSLDRIDPDGDYEPGNVRWADIVTQRANRRTA